MKATILVTINSPEIQFLQDTIEALESSRTSNVHFSAIYDTKEGPHLDELLFLEITTNDDEPVFLTDRNQKRIRELSSSELDDIQSHGQVAALEIQYPSADKYGAPLATSDIPELQYATVANLGFQPKLDLNLITVDTQDDSGTKYFLQVETGIDLYNKIENTSLMVANRVAEALSLSDPYDLEAALYQYSAVTTQEIQDFLKETVHRPKDPNLLQRFERAKAVYTMRTVLDK